MNKEMINRFYIEVISTMAKIPKFRKGIALHKLGLIECIQTECTSYSIIISQVGPKLPDPGNQEY